MAKNPHSIAAHVIEDGAGFKLSDHDPDDTGRGLDKESGTALLQERIAHLAKLQERLYADHHWSLLLVFQAMDAAGKDGTIKHVLSGVNPQGCVVHSFKAPSTEELAHDFLWRCAVRLPERGMIGIFNRSYYEEVLVAKVHPELLDRQGLSPRLVGKQVWDERYQDIRSFERHLSRSGTVVRKFFLNISKDEQKRRFIKRIEDTDRNWKFSAGDVTERGHWDAYMDAYQQAIRHTASAASPWIVVPANHKWYARLVVVTALIETLESLDLRYPNVGDDERKRLLEVRTQLMDS